MKAVVCTCGGTPRVNAYQAQEDLCEAYCECTRCGFQSDSVERPMGGAIMREWAVNEWNRAQQERHAATSGEHNT